MIEELTYVLPLPFCTRKKLPYIPFIVLVDGSALNPRVAFEAEFTKRSQIPTVLCP